MKRWMWVSLLFVGSVLCLAGFVTFLLPEILKSQVMQRVEAATSRRLEIGELSINPFTWTFEIRDLRFSELRSRETFLTFSSARIAMSPMSVFRRAPIVASAHLASPRLRIVRTGANSYNFSDLLKWLPKHPRLSVNNLTIGNGSLDFIDRGLAVEKHHELRKIELAVPFVTTIPYLAKRYVAPRLSALVNGSPVYLEGKLRPFPRAVEATVTLDLKEVALPYYLAYLPRELPVRAASGRLSARVALSYLAAQKRNPELTLSGNATLADLKLADRTGAPFLEARRLGAVIDRARPLTGEFDLSSLSADALEVFLSRDRKGTWSHSRLAGGSSPGEAAPRKIQARVTRTQLRNGRFHFVDSLCAGGFRADLEGISLDMTGYSTSPGKRASFALSFATLRGERASLKGELSAIPLTISSTIDLAGVNLETYSPYLVPMLGTRVQGSFDASAHLDFGVPGETRLDQVMIRARGLSVPLGKKQGLSQAALSIEGGSYSQKEHLLQAADVVLRNGVLRLSRDRQGTFTPLASRQPGARRAAQGKIPPAAPLGLRIGRISGAGMNAVFTDEREWTSFTLKKMAFSLEKLTLPSAGSIPFKLSGAYGKAGSLGASGSFSPSSRQLKAALNVRGIPLVDFGSYMPQSIRATIADGRLDGRLTVSLSGSGEHQTGSFGGSAGIHNLHCLDAKGKELLKWESLEMDRIKGSLPPLALDIDAVALTRFYTRIVVEKDGHLNLAQLYARQPAQERGEPAAAGGKLSIRIGTFTMQDGTLAFTDHHVKGGYATTLFNLGGRISGISSKENSFADVDLRGSLEHASPLRITGRINPLQNELFADLKVSFTDIELPPMTPYSGTYLGYAVERGKLYLHSDYRLEKRKLNWTNRVFIDQLYLGRRMESAKETSLPVLLALALLRDRNGEIHLELPVSGQTDDPHFGIRHMVLEVWKKLVHSAQQSPFALMRTLFGEKEDLSGVSFAPGSAELSPDEQGKLLRLAKVLNDRPTLRIGVAGFADQAQDAEGYRYHLLLGKMRVAKSLDLMRQQKKPGAGPGSIEIAPEEFSRYLKAAYAREKFPKPRNFLGQVKALPDDEMKKLMLAHTIVGEEHLHDLATARAAGVRRFLVETGRIAAERVFLKKSDLYPAEAQGRVSGSRVELELAVE